MKAKEIDISRLGRNVKYLRVEKGMSQEELAMRVGITKNTLSDIERSVTTPKIDTIGAIAETYGVSIDTLTFGDLSHKTPEEEK